MRESIVLKKRSENSLGLYLFVAGATSTRFATLRRKKRQTAGIRFQETKQIKRIEIDPIPRRLVDRKLDLGDINAARTDLLVAAMNSNVQGIQVLPTCQIGWRERVEII